MNLEQTILGVRFSNPTVLASGPMGLISSGWQRIAREGAGGITTKSVWEEARPGHPSPVVLSTDAYTLNAVGLSASGFAVSKEEITSYQTSKIAPLIVSVCSETIGGFGDICAKVSGELSPDFIELNISCPNVEDTLGRPFSCNREDAAAVVKAAKKNSGDIPVFAKLSPLAPDIGAIAAACVDAGADGITAINTAGPGMAIDLRSRLPILSNHVGGMSGTAVKPIAVRCVSDIYKATGGKVPIIGTGGVSTGEDALEMMMAGASLVGIATAMWTRGIDVFHHVSTEMAAWCSAEGVTDISEVIGSMHKVVKTLNVVPGQKNDI